MIPVFVVLALTGCFLIIGSFIFGDSFSVREKSSIMTEDQIEQLLESRFSRERERLEDETERSADMIRSQTERELEKLSNEKIMAVNEFSDQVMDQINKNHNEVMFLYGMLNDKQKELDSAMKQLNRAKQQTENETKLVKHAQTAEKKEAVQPGPRQEERRMPPVRRPARKPEQVQKKPENGSLSEEEQYYMNREKILKLQAEGLSSLEIAQQLHLGIGEVQLVLELSKERS